MTRRLASFTLCIGFAILGGACATKDFVREHVSELESKLGGQVTATQTQLTERADLQETKLRDTAERTGETRQAVDAADERLRGLDTRVGEVGSLAEGAQTRADRAAVLTQDAEARLAQRFAGRNKYRLIDTKSVYFGSGQVELRSQDVGELDELAKALTADPNAILELQGFADSQGSDRFNRELARERVEAVVTYLVQKHGVELRQLSGTAMGKVTLGPGEKPSAETLARARRVDGRLFSPWSSWEDTQAQSGERDPNSAKMTMAPATMAGLPDESEPSSLPRAALDERPARRVEDPPARRRLPELLRTITPLDLGAK
jgi:outer membrane protein OmpA-like peptidoglycan-associated protein